ncbi:MAG: hypothetical protein KDE53_13385 [Caldilineaceae bacterium]|nr:hypothetical protein [Caldilineaceae bacterium]
MIDHLATLRTYLAAQPALTTLVSSRIYAGRTYPPKGYTPGQRAICFNSRGGQVAYHAQTLRDSIQFKCYGADEVDAMTVYRALVDVLHDASGVDIRHAELEISGYPLQEPETDWHFVLTYFTVHYMTGLGD